MKANKATIKLRIFLILLLYGVLLNRTYSQTETGCISGNCENSFGTYIWQNGEKYIGYWQNSQRSGLGTNYYVNGSVFYGNWQNNLRNGYGIEANKKYYITAGSWKSDIYDPTSKNNYGCVSGNCYDGYGTYIFSSGAIYVGNFARGTFDKFGYYADADNANFYIGQWTAGKKNGKGIMFYKNGSKNSGLWEDNKFIKIMNINVSTDLISDTILLSTGCVEGNCNNGYGTFVFESGAIYKGNWVAGKFSGMGNYTYSNGDNYTGEFLENKRHGAGIYTFVSGKNYNGAWENGKYNGYGTLTEANGTATSGFWKDNILVEESTLEFAEINWIFPEEKIINTEEISIELNICINSNSEIISSKLMHNNQEIALQRGFVPISTDCDYNINYNIELKEGKNIFSYIVENKAGIKTSDERIVWSGSHDENQKSKLALIIGNSTYKDAPLKNPENDAVAIAQKLDSLNFETILLTNVTKNEMLKEIRNFGQKLLEQQGTALFYFAGHGLQVNGENYLIPIGAIIEKELDVELEAVSLQRVINEMEYAKTEMNILILDACRNNPFARSFRSGGLNGLATTSAPQGTFIAFATSPGSVASDGEGNLGLYTGELVKALDKNGLRIEDLFKEVRTNVYKNSNKQQLPWENSSIFTDFYFNP